VSVLKDYYVVLGIERSDRESELAALKKKRRQLKQQQNLNLPGEKGRNIDEMVETVDEAIVKFGNDEEYNKYKHALSNRREETVSKQPIEATRSAESEIYKKELASAEAYLKDKLYDEALERAKKLHLEHKTLRVFEIIAECHYRKDDYSLVLRVVDEAANEYDLVSTWLVVMYAHSCEQSGQNYYNRAKERLLQLRQLNPEDYWVDSQLADFFLNYFSEQYIPLAREPLDALLNHTGANDKTIQYAEWVKWDDIEEMIEWDLRWEFKQEIISLPQIIKKMSIYLSKPLPNSEKQRLLEGDSGFISKLEDYIPTHHEEIKKFMAGMDEILLEANNICRANISAWDIACTLVPSNDLNKDWISVTDKYASIPLSKLGEEMVDKTAKNLIKELPTYKEATKKGEKKLSPANNADYPAVYKILNRFKSFYRHRASYENINKVEEMLLEIDLERDYPICSGLLKKHARTFRILWILFALLAVPLLYIATVWIVNNYVEGWGVATTSFLENVQVETTAGSFDWNPERTMQHIPFFLTASYTFSLLMLLIVKQNIKGRLRHGNEIIGFGRVFIESILALIVLFAFTFLVGGILWVGTISPDSVLYGIEITVMESFNQFLAPVQDFFNFFYPHVYQFLIPSVIVVVVLIILMARVAKKINHCIFDMWRDNTKSVLLTWIKW